MIGVSDRSQQRCRLKGDGYNPICTAVLTGKLMNMITQINEKLTLAMSINTIEVTNESHLHNVPPGSESHFKVVLVSNDFAGKTPVKRHQLVYGILESELRHSIHALALHTYTEQEWQKRQKLAPTTPDCLGGKGK